MLTSFKKPILSEQDNIATGFLAGGKFDSQRITRVSAHYLRQCRCQETENVFAITTNGKIPIHIAANIELKRRGERSGEVEVSSHAIDRFSSKFIHVYLKRRKKGEGIVSFLERLCISVIHANSTSAFGIKFQIDSTKLVPILKTVYEDK